MRGTLRPHWFPANLLILAAESALPVFVGQAMFRSLPGPAAIAIDCDAASLAYRFYSGDPGVSFII